MRYALIALAMSATAAHAYCIHIEDAFHQIEDNGYTVTFSGNAGDKSLNIAQHPDGRWISFTIEGEEACMFGSGLISFNNPLPPNV